MSLYLPERKGNDSWNGQEHNKTKRGLSRFGVSFFCFSFLVFFFFGLWCLALQKATLGIDVRARQCFKQCIERAPLGAGIVRQMACPK